MPFINLTTESDALLLAEDDVELILEQVSITRFCLHMESASPTLVLSESSPSLSSTLQGPTLNLVLEDC